MRNNINKSEKVWKHLKEYGHITSLEAIDLYGATRLSAIIYNLRKRNHNIEGYPSQCTDRYGNTATYTTYVYVPEFKKPGEAS